MTNTPLNNITIDGKLYDVLNAIPKKEHELIYTDKNDGEDTLVTKPLMLENVYVIENDDEFKKCTEIGIETPKILNEWVQYSDRICMPEYGKGLSRNYNNYESINSYGYGYWRSDSELNISNQINSTDYNGYINPQKSNKFNYTSIIGTNKGNTTGDWGGFALIDDSNAVARHIIDNDGNKYFRNTLYDLFTGTTAQTFDETIGDIQRTNLWCAWVNEDIGKGIAYVIYGNKTSNMDNFPNGIVKVYRINKIETREDRIKYEDFGKTATISSTQESYGYVVTLNVLTQNASGIEELNIGNKGTIIIFTNVFPCGTFRNDSSFTITNSNKQCFIVNPEGISNVLLGTTLVPYDTNLDLNTTAGYSFIRSDVSFDNGVLKIFFSDAKGEKGGTMPSDYLDTKNINTNFPLNGSQIVVDFKSSTCEIIPYSGYTGTQSNLFIDDLNNLTNSNVSYDITIPNGEGGNETKTEQINVFDSFKGDVKFMYIAHSFQNLKYKCNGLSYHDRLIIDNRDNSVWVYDYIENKYKKDEINHGVDYFTGSRLTYNIETEKLFYSNGRYITCIAANCCNNNDESVLPDNDVIPVIIPEYEGDTEPSGLGVSNLGEYYFNTNDNKLYVFKQDDKTLENTFQIADISIKFINKDETLLYVYDTTSQQWKSEDGVINKIYLSSNTNEFLTWSLTQEKFVKFTGESDILNSPIHFTEVGGVFDTTLPEASSVTYNYVLGKETEGDEYYQCYKKTIRRGPNRVTKITWLEYATPEYIIKINNIDNEGDDLLFKNTDNGYQQLLIDDFIENTYYINDNNGDVYTWNGYDLIKLSNDDLSELLPEKNTFIVNFNSVHDDKLNKPFITDSGGAITSDTEINSYQVDGEHDVIAINGETYKQTFFTLKIYHDNSNTIHQNLYNNDVLYTRSKKNNSWSNWSVKFTKTNFSLDIQQVSYVTTLGEDEYDFNEENINEYDKKFKIKIRTNDDEFIKINESFLSFNFYRKYNRHNINKWRFIGQRIDEKIKTPIPIISNGNGITYNTLQFNLNQCERTKNSQFYVLPFTQKQLMQGLIWVCDENKNIKNLNDAMKYGCGTEFSYLRVWRKSVDSMYTNNFTMYGYGEGYNLNGESYPSISIVLGINLSFGGLNGDCTEIIPCKFKMKFRYLYPKSGIVYSMSNIFTNSVK